MTYSSMAAAAGAAVMAAGVLVVLVSSSSYSKYYDNWSRTGRRRRPEQQQQPPPEPTRSLPGILRVKIPISCLDDHPDLLLLHPDDEGLVLCDVHFDTGGDIVPIPTAITMGLGAAVPAAAAPAAEEEEDEDNEQNEETAAVIALPGAFCDAHTHLVKTSTVPRTRNHSGTILEALLDCEVRDSNQYWNRSKRRRRGAGGMNDNRDGKNDRGTNQSGDEEEDDDDDTPNENGDVYRRMEFGIQCALYHGTRALRTHLDGTAHENKTIGETVWRAFDALHIKYRDRIVLQGVANLRLPQWSDVARATKFCDEALVGRDGHRRKNVVLGAYCGNTASVPLEETLRHLHAFLTFAWRHGNVDVDLHMDESDDSDCCTLSPFCEALRTARARGYTGSVVLGHCCALSLQESAVQRRIVSDLAELDDVTVVVNPFTNLGLQDRRQHGRRGSSSSSPPPRTPQWRGLTLVQELQHASVNVVCASDNVRDYWYPYGDYDLLSVWKQCQAMAHLDTAPSAGCWAHLVTRSAARAMKVSDNNNDEIDDGDNSDNSNRRKSRDWIIFPKARRFSELFARPQTGPDERWIVRNGVRQIYTLPDFSALDDLMK